MFFLGYKAGYSNTTGRENTFVGPMAGLGNTTGSYNFFAGGTSTGQSNTTGSRNIFIGNNAGGMNTTGQRNTYIGLSAGSSGDTTSGNIFIGYKAGRFSKANNTLIIANNETLTPLIQGDFIAKQLTFNGKVGVGTSAFPTSVGGVDVSTYKLFVKGGILAEEVRVRTGWADYVFDKNYSRKSLSEVGKYIKHNGRLPGMPSSAEVEAQGLALGKIIVLQQEKLEELTLYAIDQEKEVQVQKDTLEALRKEIVELRRLLNEVKAGK